MQPLLKSCCGLDVHKSMFMACIAHGPLDKPPMFEIKKFSTMTDDLRTLKEWLKEYGVTAVAMGSTGIYWKPIFNILEDDFDVVLANAQHIKNVPGKKTDVKDCQWIAHLFRNGLISGSFIPPREIRELRDLTRTRRKLVEAMTAENNRVQKVLEDANIKISSVLLQASRKSRQLQLSRKSELNMSRFPNEAHLSSWAAMCPGNNESAGKKKSGKTRRGNNYLKATLTEAAWAASRTKDTALSAMYHNIARRRGKNRALIAVGHQILVEIYRVLKTGEPYQDVGAEHQLLQGEVKGTGVLPYFP